MNCAVASTARHLAFLASLAAVHSFAAPSFAAGPPQRPWFEQVERDRDRGAGRILDDPAWETRRLRESRDVRLGRLRSRREFERLDEERNRRLQLDAREQRGQRSLLEPGRDGGSVILAEPSRAGGAILSPMAAQAAADERALRDAKEKLERSLRGVNVAEQRALRTLRRRLNREGRAREFVQESPTVRERYERLRAGHRGDYQRVRSRILGRP